jgi:hypothetical protein
MWFGKVKDRSVNININHILDIEKSNKNLIKMLNN